MRYVDLKVNYTKPDIWRRPSIKKLSSKIRPYMEYAKEIAEFGKFKEDAVAEIQNAFKVNADHCQTMNELNMRFSELFEMYGKAVIPSAELDPQFLLEKTNRNTLQKKLQGWCKNLVFNIPTVIKAKPYRNLAGKFKNVPAFVVLAGPSMKNNRELLKKVGEKGIVIAVDTSLRPLLDIKVTPHLCVTHDANPNGCKFFLSNEHPYNVDNTNFNDLPDEKLALAYAAMIRDKERLNFKYDTIGLFVNYCHPLTLLAWNGTDRRFYGVIDPSLPVYDCMAGCCSYRDEEGKFLPEDKGRIVGGSSVGHVATYIAVSLGCNPISFIGLDLSYPGGKTYVEGSSNQKDMTKQKLIEMEDLSSNKVPTNLSMLSYKMVFERSLPSIIGQTQVKFYNCTEDTQGRPAGILEVGAEPKSLDWVISNHCTKEFKIKEVLLNG